MVAHGVGIVVHVSPAIAGLLDLDVPVLVLTDSAQAAVSLDDVVRRLEARAPGALVEPASRELRRHIHVSVNWRPVTALQHPLAPGDVVRVDLRMLDGG